MIHFVRPMLKKKEKKRKHLMQKKKITIFGLTESKRKKFLSVHLSLYQSNRYCGSGHNHSNNKIICSRAVRFNKREKSQKKRENYVFTCEANISLTYFFVMKRMETRTVGKVSTIVSIVSWLEKFLCVMENRTERKSIQLLFFNHSAPTSNDMD